MQNDSTVVSGAFGPGRLHDLNLCAGVRLLLFDLLLGLSWDGLGLSHIFLILPFGNPPDICALVWCFFVVIDAVLDIMVEVFLCADIVNILYDLVGLDIKLGHVESYFLLLAQ